MHIPPVNFVFPPSTFPPEKESEKAEIEGSPIFHNLMPELQDEVVAKTDYVTRIFFTWTCTTYFNRYVQRDQFDGRKLLDKCAKMGNRKLVAACVEEYGVPVDIVTIYKAARHGHSYDELWRPFLGKIPLASDRYGYDPMNACSRNMSRTAEWSARGGHLKLSSDLFVCSKSVRGESPSADERYVHGVSNLSPDRLIYLLAKGGHVDHVEWVYAHLSDHQRTISK